MSAASMGSLALTAAIALGCGARSDQPIGSDGQQEEAALPVPCSPIESVHFVRPADDITCVETDGARDVVFRDQQAWTVFWDQHVSCFDGSGYAAPAPEFDFEQQVIIGVMLEGGCSFSGCGNAAALITSVHRAECRLTVRKRLPAPDELGPCSACVQPRDFVTVDVELIGRVDEVVFE